jgi:hydrogenase maturation protein HypF
VVEDLLKKKSPAEISLKFHKSLTTLFVKAVTWASEQSGIDKVTLSGGCFQNAFLLSQLEDELEKKGFRVYTHNTVPCNDGGLSLGQAVIAGYRGERCV